MVWDKNERRKNNGRRMSDKVEVCPFHDLQCKAVLKNRDIIEDLKTTYITKEDLKEVYQVINAVKKEKADWKVLSLYIASSVVAFGLFIGIMLYETRDSKQKIEVVRTNVTIMEANQKVLMRAFNIEPLNSMKEVKKHEKEVNKKDNSTD